MKIKSVGRKLLIVCLSVFCLNVSAWAGELPPGCYVADYYRTDDCYIDYSGFYTWNQSTDLTYLYKLYGDPVSAIIRSGFINEVSLDQCINDSNNIVRSYNALSIKTTRQASKIRKLKAACGSRCAGL